MRYFILSLLMVVSMVSGCSMNQSDYLMDKARVDAEAQEVWSLPHLLSADVDLNTTHGYADQTRILYFIVISGDKTSVELPAVLNMFGKRVALDSLSSIAAGRAIDSGAADGLLLTRVETESKGIPIFYQERSVTVSGKPLILSDHGKVPVNDYLRSRLLNISLGGTSDKVLDSGFLNIMTGK